MVKRPGLGKRKRLAQGEESEAPKVATDFIKPPDESVSTQSAVSISHHTYSTGRLL